MSVVSAWRKYSITPGRRRSSAEPVLHGEPILQMSPTILKIDGLNDDVRPTPSPFRKVNGSYEQSHHEIGHFRVSIPPSRKHSPIGTVTTIPPPHHLQDYSDVTSQKTLHLVAERRNERLGRVLKVTQSDLPFVGANTIETEIDVYETNIEKDQLTVIFSVKHAHSGLWGRQTVVHRNLLLACRLAGVQSPLDIPSESIRLFEQVDAPQNIHNYMERIMQFVKIGHLPGDICIYWWRAVGDGCVVVQNLYCGKLLFFPNGSTKTLPTAVRTLMKALASMKKLPSSFFIRDPYYSCSAFLESGFEEIECEKRTPDSDMSSDDETLKSTTTPSPLCHEAASNTPIKYEPRSISSPTKSSDGLSDSAIDELIKSWALSDGVSPWATNLVLRLSETKRRIYNIRYSIGMDPQDPKAISIQVHRNEPFSRELKAFPICMSQIVPHSNQISDVRVAYSRALFFVKKLFDYHMRLEGVFVGSEGVLQHTNQSRRHAAARAPLRSSRQALCNSRKKKLMGHCGTRSTGNASLRGLSTPSVGKNKSSNSSTDNLHLPANIIEEANGDTHQENCYIPGIDTHHSPDSRSNSVEHVKVLE